MKRRNKDTGRVSKTDLQDDLALSANSFSVVGNRRMTESFTVSRGHQGGLELKISGAYVPLDRKFPALCHGDTVRRAVVNRFEAAGREMATIKKPYGDQVEVFLLHVSFTDPSVRRLKIRPFRTGYDSNSDVRVVRFVPDVGGLFEIAEGGVLDLLLEDGSVRRFECKDGEFAECTLTHFEMAEVRMFVAERCLKDLGGSEDDVRRRHGALWSIINLTELLQEQGEVSEYLAHWLVEQGLTYPMRQNIIENLARIGENLRFMFTDDAVNVVPIGEQPKAAPLRKQRGRSSEKRAADAALRNGMRGATSGGKKK